MSRWGSAKASRVLSALYRIGWHLKRQGKGSHRILAPEVCLDFIFAVKEGRAIGPRMLSRISKHTGLKPEDV